ncbi:MAG: hypothetical protein ACRDHP_19450 [Ktedonobacterales bacterium]
MSAADRRSSVDETPFHGARRMPVQNDSQQPTTLEPSTPACTDTEKTVAAPARAGVPQPQAAPPVPEPATAMPSNDEAPLDEQATTLVGQPNSLPDALAPSIASAPGAQPLLPANFTPHLAAGNLGSDPNALTYRDLAPPHPPRGWQAPPIEQGQARQPSPRFPHEKTASPLPTHAPWQVASSWGATTLNIQANTAAGASYLLWWLSGLLVYFNERHNRFVRFHAMQSILLTGVLSVYSVIAYLVSQLCYDVASATDQHAFHTIGTTIAALSFLAVIGVWLAAMIIAWSGTYLHWPVVGKYAERYAAPPAQPPQF